MTNTNDSGAGSLRAAIDLANSTAGVDTITFDPSLSGGTITLTSGELLITDDLNINGLGETNLTLSGGGNSRVLNVDDSNPGNQIDVALTGVTISGGFEALGAGLRNTENLTVTDSTITGNSANVGAGIFSFGAGSSLSVNNSTVSGNGAASAGGGVGGYFWGSGDRQ